MGRAKKRRELARLIKEMKLPFKLYRGNKFKFYRHANGSWINESKQKLELSQPGRLVNDCDAFNHIVKGFPEHLLPQYYTWNRWFGTEHFHAVRGYFADLVNVRVEFEDGGWNCGCPASPCKAESWQKIEAFLLEQYRYFGTCGEEAVRKRWDALEAGQRITDDRGVLLPEYR